MAIRTIVRYVEKQFPRTKHINIKQINSKPPQNQKAWSLSKKVRA